MPFTKLRFEIFGNGWPHGYTDTKPVPFAAPFPAERTAGTPAVKRERFMAFGSLVGG